MKTKFCSIIITHFAMNDQRSKVMRKSILSLIEHTKYPYELIVVDNGDSDEDSQWLMEFNKQGKITIYLRNANNMHFAFARNQAFKLSHGDFICIADNDILYKPGWLEECVEILEANLEKKIYTTPMEYPMRSINNKYCQGYFTHNGHTLELNQRAGSNCFVIRRNDYETIGDFPHHRIGGSHWTDKAVRAGFVACVIPDLGVKDIGLRQGYNFKEHIPICKTLSNGKKVYFNVDKFKKEFPDEQYI